MNAALEGNVRSGKNHLAHLSFLLLPDRQLCSRHMLSKWNGTACPLGTVPWQHMHTVGRHLVGTHLASWVNAAVSAQEQPMSGQGSWKEIARAPIHTKHQRAWLLAGTHDQHIQCQHHGLGSWTAVSKHKPRFQRTYLLGAPSCGSLQVSGTEVPPWLSCCI